MTQADLIVIGGGPAGSATAIAAARGGMSVVLFERSTGPVMKVCGEVLSEAGVAMAKELGCEWLETTVSYSDILFVDDERPDNGIGVPLRPSARGVPRTLLDEGLLRAAIRSGVDVRRGVRIGRRCRDGEDFLVTPVGDGEPVARAPRLVIATGRRAASGPGCWVGRRGDASVEALAARRGLTMWFYPNGGYVGVAMMTEGAATRTSLDVVRPAPVPTTMTDHLRATSTRVGTPPFRLGMVRVPAEAGVYRVGDAMAAWPPLVGDGMTAALLSGARLGSLLAAPTGLDAHAWPAIWSDAWGGTLRRALWLHSLLTQPRWRRTAWRFARSWRGMGAFIEFGVRLRPSARAATINPCTRGG